jgi:hypothetical protein
MIGSWTARLQMAGRLGFNSVANYLDLRSGRSLL